MTAKTLESLAVGDFVALSPGALSLGGRSGLPLRRPIIATTKAQILLAGATEGFPRRFWKKNGREVGGESYYAARINPWTEDHDRLVAQAKARATRLEKIDRLASRDAWKALSDAQLDAAIALLEQMTSG